MHMKITGNHGWTLVEVIMSVAIFSIVVLAVQRGLELSKKSSAMAKTSYDNQTNAKGALHVM